MQKNMKTYKNQIYAKLRGKKLKGQKNVFLNIFSQSKNV